MNLNINARMNRNVWSNMENLHWFCHLWVYLTPFYPSTLLYVHRIVNYSRSVNKHIKALLVTQKVSALADMQMCAYADLM